MGWIGAATCWTVGIALRRIWGGRVGEIFTMYLMWSAAFWISCYASALYGALRWPHSRATQLALTPFITVALGLATIAAAGPIMCVLSLLYAFDEGAHDYQRFLIEGSVMVAAAIALLRRVMRDSEKLFFARLDGVQRWSRPVDLPPS